MPLTPSKKGREVLAQLPNGIDASQRQEAPGVSKMTADAANEGQRISVVVQPGSKKTVSSGGSDSPPFFRRPSLSSAANKRGRPSPHLKRVSFGGDTINIIKQHVSEFATPPSDSAQTPTPSPPRKSMRSSGLSSPSPARSPMFARPNPDLYMDEGDGQDDTVTVPDANKLMSGIERGSSISNQEAAGTPVPLRGHSISGGDRESFGMFLDTDVGTGVGDMHTRGESDHTLSFAQRDVHSIDSPSGDSDGDVTQNIIGIVERTEQDEAADDDAQYPEPGTLGQGVQRAEPPDSNRRISSSVRKSLPYYADLNSVKEKHADVLKKNKDRWSMVPITEGSNNLRVDRDSVDSASPNDTTFHVQDLLGHLEDDNTETANSSLNVCAVEVREKLPDNRQLFDSGEEPTIHFHDEIEPVKAASFVTNEKGAARTESGQKPSTSSTETAGDNEFEHHEAMEVEQSPAKKGAMPTKSILKNPTSTETLPEPSGNTAIPSMQLNRHQSQGSRDTAAPASEMENTPLSVAKQETPSSVAGSMVRAVKEKTPIERQRTLGNQLRELSDSVLKKSSQREHQKVTKAPETKPFSIKDFLGAAKIHFDDQIAVDPRKPSLAPTQFALEELESCAPERKLLESVKKEKILSRLQNEVSKYLDKVKKTVENINVIERSIEQQHPPVFAKLSKSENLSVNEMTNLQYSLKRLQKVMFRQVRLDWVKSRQLWEEKIREDLDETVAAIESDTRSMQASQNVHLKAYEQVKTQLISKGIDINAAQDEIDLEHDADALRQRVENEHSSVFKLADDVAKERSAESELVTQRHALIPRRKQLLAEQNRLETYGGDKANKKLKAVMTERQELNAIVCRVASVKPYLITGSFLSLCLGGLMDAKITILGDDITNIDTAMVASPANASAPCQAFCEGAVHLAGLHLKRMKSVCALPFAIRGCAEQMLFTKRTLSEAKQYFDMYLGEITSAKIEESSPPSLDITALGSFYSLKLGAKFDILLTISTFFPDPASGSISQDVKQVDIIRFIGNTPTDNDLRDTLTVRGFRQAPDIFSLTDAFSGIWKLLH